MKNSMTTLFKVILQDDSLKGDVSFETLTKGSASIKICVYKVQETMLETNNKQSTHLMAHP